MFNIKIRKGVLNMIEIVIEDKVYKKEDKSTKRSIDKGIAKLEARLCEYLSRNVNIENVFDDDILIHDIINKQFYVYKCQVDKFQLRILYKVDGQKLVIVSHYFKKSPNKEYIRYFEKVAVGYI